MSWQTTRADGSLKLEPTIDIQALLEDLLSGEAGGTFRLKPVDGGGYDAQIKVGDGATPWHTIMGMLSDSDYVMILDPVGEA